MKTGILLLRATVLPALVFVVTFFGGFFGACFGQGDATVALSGRFVSDLDHKPLGKVFVTLRRSGQSTMLATATTSDAGTFSFPRLEPGGYSIVTSKAGYFMPASVGVWPVLYGMDVEVRSGGQGNLGDIELVHERRIRGTIRWQDGEPAVNATVFAIPMQAGKPARLPAKQAQTDDRGVYALDALAPGRYIVAAMNSFESNEDGPDHRSLRHLTLPRFYPNAATVAAARPIDLRHAAAADAIPFTLHEPRVVMVAGSITTPSDEAGHDPFDIGHLELVPKATPFAPIWTEDLERNDKGFSFQFLPPGEYLLSIPEWGVLHRTVNVGQTNVRNLSLQPSFSRTKITAELEETHNGRASRSPTGAAFVRVQAYGIASEPHPVGPSPDYNWEDGTAPLIPGATYVLADELALPPNTYVATVTQSPPLKAGPTPRPPLSFMANGGTVRVLLRRDGGTVTGQVTDTRGTRAARAFAVLAPRNRAVHQRYRITLAGLDRAFRLTAVAPGRYDLFAFSRNDEDWYTDEGYLKRFATGSVAVEVKPNGSVNVHVNVIPVH